MGQSTDAILVYGVDIGDESELDIELPEVDEDSLDGESGMFEYVEKVCQKYNCELITHCSCEYPMYIIAAKGTELRAWRGYSQKVSKLRNTPKQDKNIAAVLKALGLPKQKPSWVLASNWC